jgi:hypothetical protein
MRTMRATLCLLVALTLHGCAMSPPQPAQCDGSAKKPVNNRGVAALDTLGSEEGGRDSRCGRA